MAATGNGRVGVAELEDRDMDLSAATTLSLVKIAPGTRESMIRGEIVCPSWYLFSC